MPEQREGQVEQRGQEWALPLRVGVEVPKQGQLGQGQQRLGQGQRA